MDMFYGSGGLLQPMNRCFHGKNRVLHFCGHRFSRLELLLKACKTHSRLSGTAFVHEQRSFFFPEPVFAGLQNPQFVPFRAFFALQMPQP
ncbi:MAG: hypothetical protein PHO94_01550 [Petrimonas sp.]|nr:hypothetical protein [Petrimonas sp.]